jgi:hypothetical protein
MGLAVAGKSSIYSVVFEGKTPDQVKNYIATQNYVRSQHKMMGDNLEIFDLGGQESFFSIFLGDMAEFVFSNVLSFIWVVDVTDSEHVSTSKYYFDKAVEKLNEYSSDAQIFCLFHKMDLIQDNQRTNVLLNMENYYKPQNSKREIHFFGTSIFNTSIFNAMGIMLTERIIQEKKKNDVVSALTEIMEEGSSNLFGLIIFTENSLPIFKYGVGVDKFLPIATLFCSSINQIEKLPEKKHYISSIVEMEENNYFFSKIKDQFVALIFDKNTKADQIKLINEKISTKLNV